MSVEKIEEYTQKNGVGILKVYCKPTINFPEGKNFFYAPVDAIDIVKAHGWYINPHGRYGVDVIAKLRNKGYSSIYHFHRELYLYYRGYSCDNFIDHINLVEFDNTDNNLNEVTRSQNRRNCLTRGYIYRNNYYVTQTIANGLKHYDFSALTEDKICILQNRAEQENLKEYLGADWYMFDFKKYRRGSEDILDLERTGKISEEEAIYRHVTRYADNAWYMLRYGLEGYYKEYSIPIPTYSLGLNGCMIHKITGKRLCPVI